MGYRVFRDSRGTEWQTWDVVPRMGDRRVSERRTRAAEPPQSELRSRSDRRSGKGQRGVLTPALNEGWLCFETTDEKRRLAPIPHDWQRCAEQRLEQYCAQAKLARIVTRELPTIDVVA